MSSVQPITTTALNASLLSLRDKLNGSAEPVQPQHLTASDSYKALKERIHLKLLDKFDLAALETLAPEALRQEIAAMVERLLVDEQAVINETERGTLIRDIQH